MKNGKQYLITMMKMMILTNLVKHFRSYYHHHPSAAEQAITRLNSMDIVLRQVWLSHLLIYQPHDIITLVGCT